MKNGCLAQAGTPALYMKWMLVLAMAVTLAGCSWFRGGKKDQGEDYTGDMGAQQERIEAYDGGLPAPADAPAEGMRPGVLLDIPQMQSIYFDYDQSRIRPDQLSAMEGNLRWLRENPDVVVYVVGHTDERGTTEYNFALGTRRALAVQDYLTQNGISVERLATLSKGEEEPVVVGSNESAWSKNRRAEFKRMQ